MNAEAERLSFDGKGVTKTRPSIPKAPASYIDQADAFLPRPACTHCGQQGHSEDKCWKLHPELKPDAASLALGRVKAAEKAYAKTALTKPPEFEFAWMAQVKSPTIPLLTSMPPPDHTILHLAVDSCALHHLTPTRKGSTSFGPAIVKLFTVPTITRSPQLVSAHCPQPSTTASAVQSISPSYMWPQLLEWVSSQYLKLVTTVRQCCFIHKRV